MAVLRSSFTGRRFYAFFALLATIAQLVVAVSPLAEGRTARMASHVESHGSTTHFTHDDANCAACQARSIQGTTSRPTVVPVLEHLIAAANVTSVDGTVSHDQSPQTNPRAPPSVI